MYRSILILILLTISGTLVQAQTREDRFKEIKAQKVAYLTEKMDLTVEESKAFWPIYNEYEQSMRQLRGAPWPKEKDLTEKNAQKALTTNLEREEKGIELKKEFYNKITAVISYKKLYLLEVGEREFRQKLFERYKNRRDQK